MRKYDLNEINAYIEENSLNSKSLSELNPLIKELGPEQRSLILWTLEFKDEAKHLINTVKEELGLNYYENLYTCIKPETYDLIFDYSIKEYIELRTSSNKELNFIASTILAETIKDLSPVEKLAVIKEIIKDKVSTLYLDSVYDMPVIQIELFDELDVHPIEKDEKTKMAMQYAIEKISLVLDADEESFYWKLESKITHQLDKFWDSVKDAVTSFSKNTVGSPTFRKYAIAGIALGVAISAGDSFAGTEVRGFDLDGVKEYFNSIDNYFNENVLPKYGFNDGCEVSSRIVSESPQQVSTEITIGDRKILIDVKSVSTSWKGASFAGENVHTEVIKTGTKSSCNMDKETYINLAKSISKQLSVFKK